MKFWFLMFFLPKQEATKQQRNTGKKIQSFEMTARTIPGTAVRESPPVGCELHLRAPDTSRATLALLLPHHRAEHRRASDGATMMISSAIDRCHFPCILSPWRLERSLHSFVGPLWPPAHKQRHCGADHHHCRLLYASLPLRKR